MKDLDNRYLRVGGLVKEGSLKFENNIWKFEIIDEENKSIKVEFSKTLPNLVEENKGIIVEGRVLKKNLLSKKYFNCRKSCFKFFVSHLWNSN